MRKIFTPRRSDPNARYRKDLRTLDPESPEYWNEILRREGLDMSAGKDPRLLYVGGSRDLELEEHLALQREENSKSKKRKQAD